MKKIKEILGYIVNLIELITLALLIYMAYQMIIYPSSGEYRSDKYQNYEEQRADEEACMNSIVFGSCN